MHLIPALVIVVLLVTSCVTPWPRAPSAFWETVIPTIFCLLGSVTYHTLMAHHWQYYNYLFLDVSPLLATTSSPGVHSPFHSHLEFTLCLDSSKQKSFQLDCTVERPNTAFFDLRPHELCNSRSTSCSGLRCILAHSAHVSVADLNSIPSYTVLLLHIKLQFPETFSKQLAQIAGVWSLLCLSLWGMDWLLLGHALPTPCAQCFYHCLLPYCCFLRIFR